MFLNMSNSFIIVIYIKNKEFLLKFKTTTKIIKDHVLTVSKAVDIKPSTPALQGLYIKTNKNNCELTGSDLDLVINCLLYTSPSPRD